MKAAPITKKPSFPLMKQGDIQNIYHLQMPRWLFTDPRYIGLSLEAKVTYTFLLNRFQLSRLNGWLNDDGEVVIIYTRRSLSSEMQVSYHKIIEAMKELSSAGLIWERRCGRGDANQIYLALVEHRFGGNGLYLLDEPEAALSPTRMMSLLVLLRDLVKKHSQFIIATHSPILMAYPGACIYQLSQDGIDRVAYRDTEHYQLTRRFLEAPERMIELLFREE